MREDRGSDRRLMTYEAAPNPPGSAEEASRERWKAPAARNQDGKDGTIGFSPEERDRMKSRWKEIQTGFVDHPRQSVQEADQLVGGAVQRLSESFAKTRSSLEGQWARGEDVQTEELRMALKHYRSFLERLLGI